MDTRLNTFLVLCQTMNYRAAAEHLHLTQPAVTKQIQSLEQEYGCSLFRYDGHQLHRTPSTRLLESYAQSLRANEQEVKRAIQKASRPLLRVGATKTIGVFVLDKAVLRYLEDPERNISVTIDNTAQLLRLLEENQLDILLLEGAFDKSRYGCRLIRKEPFHGICCAEHPFAGQEIPIDRLYEQELYIREEGSGTRGLLEKDLMENGCDLSVFRRVVCVSGFPLLRKLVASGTGISFAYRAVIGDDPRFAWFKVAGFSKEHEFNAVYLKGTGIGQQAEEFLALLSV